MGKSERKGTSTSSFGTGGRISHDSSHFYSSRLYRDLEPEEVTEYLEQPLPAEARDRIFAKSSEEMRELPAYSVHLMVTSPPYNVRKDYDEDLSLEEYQELLGKVFRETYRVLVTGGRACVNIANLGRKPYIPLHALVIEEMVAAGFYMRGEIIWDKGASAAASTVTR